MSDKLTGYGEPWKSPWESGMDGNEFLDSEGVRVLGVDYYDGPLLAVEERYARRIVACVNACRGMPTEGLESLEKSVKETFEGAIDVLAKSNAFTESKRAEAIKERDEARAMVAELAKTTGSLFDHVSEIVNLGGKYPQVNGTQLIEDSYKVLRGVPGLLVKAEALHV